MIMQILNIIIKITILILGAIKNIEKIDIDRDIPLTMFMI